ncbi:MAG: metal-binding protein [Propionibacteriaceae bacterium]|jgi:uncharacterized protein|nr:metal-binding protein [Propionibacteriaceae bacterium]MBT65866.1 metal-binding protein [Synechococcus sp. NP17]|tara:strand:- start:2082 stop:2615 length:534 start_codon:yes stop_codon:yes gene_type:complete
MIPGLEPVPLRELQALGSVRDWEFEGHLEDLETLTPVRGRLLAEHRGNVLEVRGLAKTIVTLCCDRCLNQFNRALSTSTNELIWLGDREASEAMAEEGLDASALEGLVECLDPRGDFEPERWVFEQLSLQLPAVNFCGDACPGIPQSLKKEGSSSELPAVDPRWEALLTLRSAVDEL